MRLFAHDLENAILKSKKEKLLLGSKKENPKAEEIISNYLKSNFKINQNDAALKYKFIGFELENDIIWLYLESEIDLKIRDLTISNSVITNLYEDQKNIVNFKYNKKTQSQICTKSKPEYGFKIAF